MAIIGFIEGKWLKVSEKSRNFKKDIHHNIYNISQENLKSLKKQLK